MKRLILITGLLLAVLSVPIFSEATPVNIINHGFEDDPLIDGSASYLISGWVRKSQGFGVWDPSNTEMGSYFLNGIIEGENIAFSNESAISQQLSYTLLPNTMLNLMVDVGWRLDKLLQPSYSIQLWAGDTLLASESSTSLIQGQFVTSVLSYEVTADNLYLGKKLTIMLVNNISGESSQVNFDNVRLENHAVPEPSTLLLLGSGLVGLGYFIRRKRG